MSRFTSSYMERRQRLLLVLARRSQFVLFSKIVLGLMIALLLGAIIILPLLNKATRITLTSVTQGEELQPVMLNPKFQGMDAQNQPFTVTAVRAYQKNDNIVEMESIQADMTLKSRTWLLLSANHGTINSQDQELKLVGDVRLYHDQGYEFTTNSVRIDTSTGNAVGEEPIKGHGAIGNFTAKQFSIFDKGERMILSGNVTVLIKPDA